MTDTDRHNQQVTLRDGRRLGFAEYGRPDGIPLMLFHGTPGSRLFPRLEQAQWVQQFGFRVLTPERPGYGLSDPAPGHAIGDWADDVRQLADQLGLDRFHVAGGSGGGPFALACALLAPARIRSATLICSGCPPEVLRLSRDMAFSNRVAFFLAKYMPFLLKRLFAGTANTVKKRPEKFAAVVLSKMAEQDKQAIDSQGREQLMLKMNEAYRQGAEGAYRDMLLVSRPWGLDLEDLTVPVFMWHGIADNLIPVACARAFSERIPGCETRFLPDVGHQLLANEEICSQMMGRLVSAGADT